MNIIVGLGNPGTKFKNTRHNVGFMTIDKFAEKNNFPEFKLQKKSSTEISKQDGVLLAKPQTFMNESGKAVKEILREYGFLPRGKKPYQLIIIHDDVDLEIGKIKIVKDRGSAGHKGVESIIKNIGNKGLIRARIGIAPEQKPKAQDIVLKKLSSEEQKLVDKVIEKTAEVLEYFISNGLEKTMNEYNK